MLADLRLVEALGPQILDIGERGGLPWRYIGYVYLGLAAHWRGNAERAEAELRNCRRAGAAGCDRRPERFATGAAPGIPRARRGGPAALRVDPVDVAQPRARPAASARGTACSASLRRSTCVACTRKRRRCPRLSKACSHGVDAWITFDGRLVETRAGLAAAAARRWEEAERQFTIAREVAEQDAQPRSSWPI